MNVEHGGAKTRVLTRDAGLLLIYPETFVFYFNKKKLTTGLVYQLLEQK